MSFLIFDNQNKTKRTMKEQFLTLTRMERQEVNERGRILEEVCMMAPRRKKLRACDPDERRPFRGDEAFAILFFLKKKHSPLSNFTSSFWKKARHGENGSRSDFPL